MGGVIVIILALIALAVFFVPTLGDRVATKKSVNKKAVRQYWQKLETYFENNLNPKKAITEADKLLDYVLRKQHFGGQSMSERLKNAEIKFKDYEGVWKAHKLRNRIVREASFKPTKARAKKAMDSIHAALKDLGVL